jgi:hypothetical protein
MLASGHEDFVGGSRPGRTARPEDAGQTGKATGCLLDRLVHTAHRIELMGRRLASPAAADIFWSGVNLSKVFDVEI